MYHEYGNTTKHYNGQRLTGYNGDISQYLNPDSAWWEALARKASKEFDNLAIGNSDYNAFRSYLQLDKLTWKELTTIFQTAVKTWKPDVTAEALAHECGILPEKV